MQGQTGVRFLNFYHAKERVELGQVCPTLIRREAERQRYCSRAEGAGSLRGVAARQV